jgi:cytoskeletal protein RodZ
MSQYKEVIVEKVESSEARDTSVVLIFVLAVVAILVVAAVWWQPWNMGTTPTNSTTIIREPGTTTEKTILVPTPSAPAGDTNINIKTETPPPVVVPPTNEEPPTNTATNDGG